MASHCGRYELLGEIGRGGMGIVYRALDPRTNKIVAIKQLVLENIAPEKKEEFKDRFKREAHTVARLKHPNIVDVLDISVDDPFYYVMEFLDGESLRKDLMRRGGKMPLSNYFPILEQIGEALSFAHSMNIVHRDVKPDNIFILSDGTVKLTDFGIARAAEFEDANLTKTGIMMGTLAYVSPEQLQDAKSVDHRADIFSLGVVSYEALGGCLPFFADGIAATIVKIVSTDEKPLHIVDPALGTGISSAVARAMRKKPRERYRSVSEFVKDFASHVPPKDRGYIPTLAVSNTIPGQGMSSFIPAKTQFGADSSNMSTSIDGPMAGRADIASLGTSVDGPGHTGMDAMDEMGTSVDGPAGGGRAQFVADRTSVDMDEDIEAEKESNKQFLETRAEGLPKSAAPPAPASPAASNVPTGEPYKPSPKSSGIFQIGSVKPKVEALEFVLSMVNQNLSNNLTSQAKPFLEPAVLAVSNGRLAVADAATRTINVYSYDGTNVEETMRWLFEVKHEHAANQSGHISETRTKCGRITRPGGLAFDAKGKLFSCDASDQYIRIFDGRGFFLSEFKNIKAGDSGISGLTIDSTGLLYASDSANACIQIFQPETGVWLRSISTKADMFGAQKSFNYAAQAPAKASSPDLEIRLPAGLTIDRLNQIYLADYGASRIFVFNKQSNVIKYFGKKGGMEGELNIPRSVAVDKFDRVYVCDSFNNRLSVFDAGGGFLYTFGEKGSGPKQLVTPSDIAIDNQFGLIFVCDRGNKRVQIYRIPGEQYGQGSRF